MITLTINQLDAIVEYLASRLATLERIQSVSTLATMPATNSKKDDDMIVSQCDFTPVEDFKHVKPAIVKKAMALPLSLIFPGPQVGAAHTVWIDAKSRFVFFYYRTGFSMSYCHNSKRPDGYTQHLGFFKCETGYSDI